MNENGRRRWRPEERRQIVADCLRSGQSVWRFSQSIEVGYGSLCKWIKRYSGDAGDLEQGQPKATQGFVELKGSSPVPSDGAKPSAASVRFSSGDQVDFHPGCDPALIRTIIRSLR